MNIYGLWSRAIVRSPFLKMPLMLHVVNTVDNFSSKLFTKAWKLRGIVLTMWLESKTTANVTFISICLDRQFWSQFFSLIGGFVSLTMLLHIYAATALHALDMKTFSNCFFYQKKHMRVLVSLPNWQTDVSAVDCWMQLNDNMKRQDFLDIPYEHPGDTRSGQLDFSRFFNHIIDSLLILTMKHTITASTTVHWTLHEILTRESVAKLAKLADTECLNV